MSCIMRKPTFCICKKNKGALQICFPLTVKLISIFVFKDSTIPLLFKTKFPASNYLLCLDRLVCVEPGRKPRLLVNLCEVVNSCVSVFILVGMKFIFAQVITHFSCSTQVRI